MINIEKINTDIRQDIKEEFENIRKDIKDNYMINPDINHIRKKLKNYASKAVLAKSRLLIETLLNYLMKEAKRTLQPADIDLKNAFYSLNFRRKIEDSYKFNTEILKFSLDSCILYASIVGSGIVVIGGLVTLLLHGTTQLITGFMTPILSIIAFKTVYEHMKPISRKQLEDEVGKYITNSEKRVEKWLDEVGEIFIKDFIQFCKEHGFKLEKE